MKDLLILFLTVVSLNLMADPPKISKKFNKELSKHFETENLEIIEIKDLLNSSDRYYKVYSENQQLGTVVLTVAKGRYDKFDYMIVYNLDQEIDLIKVLVYRSDYGSEITAKRWLRQFYNKSDDYLKYGSDIQAISGATFSAMSLTKNVNRVNKILRDYFRE